MLFFSKRKDGGQKSNVDGFFLIELKSLFSIAILKFNKGAREEFHSHAFDALTWFVKGDIIEEDVNGVKYIYKKSLIPKVTPKDKVHKVIANKDSWCITIRGKWVKNWFEITSDKKKKITFTHGRKVVKEEVLN